MPARVVILRNLRTSKDKADLQHPDFKYALKLASLLHELGHVTDLEKEINFDIANRKLDLVEAEVFAHVWSLNTMAENCYRQSYQMVYDALKNAHDGTNILRMVARAVIEQHPKCEILDWQDFIEQPVTDQELLLLDNETVNVLSSGI